MQNALCPVATVPKMSSAESLTTAATKNTPLTPTVQSRKLKRIFRTKETPADGQPMSTKTTLIVEMKAALPGTNRSR